MYERLFLTSSVANALPSELNVKPSPLRHRILVSLMIWEARQLWSLLLNMLLFTTLLESCWG